MPFSNHIHASDAARIAVLVACYNKAASIRRVVRDFRKALPLSNTYVFDNNSSDGTADLARGPDMVVCASAADEKRFAYLPLAGLRHSSKDT